MTRQMINRTSRNATALALLLSLAISGPAHAASGVDSDGDGIPDNAETLLGTDPQNPDTDGDGLTDLKDPEPLFLENPIAQSGSPAPFSITEALVENNYDYAANKDAPDHLELLVTNASAAPVTGFSIYYTVKNADTGKTEAYFEPLDGFVVPANGEARLHLDETGLPDHFRGNPNGAYKTNTDAKIITFELAATGFAPVTVTVNKDKGGAEAAD